MPTAKRSRAWLLTLLCCLSGHHLGITLAPLRKSTDLPVPTAALSPAASLTMGHSSPGPGALPSPPTSSKTSKILFPGQFSHIFSLSDLFFQHSHCHPSVPLMCHTLSSTTGPLHMLFWQPELFPQDPRNKYLQHHHLKVSNPSSVKSSHRMMFFPLSHLLQPIMVYSCVDLCLPPPLHYEPRNTEAMFASGCPCLSRQPAQHSACHIPTLSRSFLEGGQTHDSGQHAQPGRRGEGL